MSYSVLMTIAVIAFGMIYYYLWGKEQYVWQLVERAVSTGEVAKRSR